MRQVAGSGAESIFQPGFSPAGDLTYGSDRSGWWNLEQLRGGERVTLCPRAAEFGRAQWGFALSTWAFVDSDTILCSRCSEGRDRVARLDLASGRLEDLALPFDAVDGLRVQGRTACFIGASTRQTSAVVRRRAATATWIPCRP